MRNNTFVMTPLKYRLSLWFLVVLVTAGCNRTTTLPDPPTVVPPSVTDIFAGTLKVQTSNTHNFVVTTASTVNITLRSLQPDPTSSVGIGIGVPSGITCALIRPGSTVQPSTTPQITGTALPGTLCVSVYDPGSLTDQVDYTVTVAHS